MKKTGAEWISLNVFRPFIRKLQVSEKENALNTVVNLSIHSSYHISYTQAFLGTTIYRELL